MMTAVGPAHVPARRSGFTLLEVLLALAITAMLTVAATQWLGAVYRTAAVATSRFGAVEAAVVAARLMDDDLRGALPDREGTSLSLTGGVLTVWTLTGVPGDESGRKQVSWRFDRANRQLLRVVAGGRSHVVTGRLANATWTMNAGQHPLLVVTPTEGAQAMTIPLWLP